MRVTRVGFICTGNICRSPMAEVVTTALVDADPLLRGTILISSAGTANWHVDRPMDDRARSALDRAGFAGLGTVARFADRQYLEDLDLVVAMTREQRREVRERYGSLGGRVILMRSMLEPAHDLDVADPYYGDGSEFDACLGALIPACQELVRVLRLGGEPFAVSPPAT